MLFRRDSRRTTSTSHPEIRRREVPLSSAFLLRISFLRLRRSARMNRRLEIRMRRIFCTVLAFLVLAALAPMPANAGPGGGATRLEDGPGGPNPSPTPRPELTGPFGPVYRYFEQRAVPPKFV